MTLISSLISPHTGPTQIVMTTCFLRTSLPGLFCRAWVSYHTTFMAAPSATLSPFFSQCGLLAPTYRALKAKSSRKVVRQTHGMASTFRNKLYYSAGKGEPKQLQSHIGEHDSDIHQSKRIRASQCMLKLIIWLMLYKSHSLTLAHRFFQQLCRLGFTIPILQ